MSKTLRIDCSKPVGEQLAIRDMTAEEEARLADDRAMAEEQHGRERLRRTQRADDLATVKSGPATPGYNDALCRLLGGT